MKGLGICWNSDANPQYLPYTVLKKVLPDISDHVAIFPSTSMIYEYSTPSVLLALEWNSTLLGWVQDNARITTDAWLPADF